MVKSRVPLGPGSQDESFAFFRPIGISIDIYYLDDNILKNVNTPPNLKFQEERRTMTGVVWFTKYFLENKGWNNDYLDNIVNRLVNGKSVLKKLLVTEYHVKFIR